MMLISVQIHGVCALSLQGDWGMRMFIGTDLYGCSFRVIGGMRMSWLIFRVPGGLRMISGMDLHGFSFRVIGAEIVLVDP